MFNLHCNFKTKPTMKEEENIQNNHVQINLPMCIQFSLASFGVVFNAHWNLNMPCSFNIEYTPSSNTHSTENRDTKGKSN